ncbi:MAG: branched-chain amino acid ABC transporter substrate-binding protein [Chloroflexota bacterium]
MRKFTLTMLGVMVIAALLLAACAPAATPTEAPPVETVAPVETEAPPPPFECTDAIGCVDIAPGDPIHLAYLLVVTGANETLGVDSRNGIEIAVDDLGGLLLGHPILLTGEDGGCGAEGGQTAGTRLAADPSIVAVIGTSCSSEARAALPLLDAAGFAVVSPSNTAPDLTEPGNENNYVPTYARTAHNDNLQGRIAAEYVFNELGIRTTATIHDGSLYAQRLAQVFAARFRELGGTVTNEEAVQAGQTVDMHPVLTLIAANQPELIYFPIFIAEGVFIITQAREVSGLEDTVLMGADGLFSPDVMTGAGDAVEGFRVSSPALGGAAYQEFLDKYETKFGRFPISIFHAHAYDATMIIARAIEQVAVQDADGTLHIPRQALREAIHNTTNFPGVTGTLTCNETIEPVKNPGDCAAAGIGVYMYHAGEYPPELIWTPGE